jgi:hypothetical protein
MSDLFDAPLDFHPTRQLHSALIARGMYYQTLQDAPEWKRGMAYKQWKAEGLIEPQIMERLTAFTYQIIGSEQLWVARLWAIFFWMIAGVILFLITEKMADFVSGTFAVMYFFVWPYAAFASRSFQPEPLLIASMLAALWSLLKWSEKQNPMWAIVAGILCGFSIFVKSTAIFFIIPTILGLIIDKFGIKSAFKNRQTWIVGILSFLPFLAYVFYGEVILGILGDQFIYRFFPNRWLDPLFYIQWIIEIDNTVGIIIFLSAILGIFLFAKKKYLYAFSGFLIGYVIYGFTFSYHITTHDYYQLPLMIPVSIGFGILMGRIFSISKRKKLSTKIVFTIVSMIFIGVNFLQIRSVLSRSDFSDEIKKWEMVGDRFGHESRVIGIFPDYGYRLAYWGWMHISSWTTSDDVNLRQLAGQNVNLKDVDRIRDFDYFVIADNNEYENQEFLKNYFESNFLKSEEIEDLIIYDLRAGE